MTLFLSAFICCSLCVCGETHEHCLPSYKSLRHVHTFTAQFFKSVESWFCNSPVNGIKPWRGHPLTVSLSPRCSSALTVQQTGVEEHRGERTESRGCTQHRLSSSWRGDPVDLSHGEEGAAEWAPFYARGTLFFLFNLRGECTSGQHIIMKQAKISRSGSAHKYFLEGIEGSSSQSGRRQAGL